MTVTDVRPIRRMVALDIDGTLVPDSGIDVPEPTRRAVADAVGAGIDVVLATGRSLKGALPVAIALGLDGTRVVASNGAVTARVDSTWPGGYELEDSHTLAGGSVLELARRVVPGIKTGAEDIGWGYHVSELFDPGQLNGRQYVVSQEVLERVQTPRLVLAGRDAVEYLHELVASLDVTVNINGPHWLDVTPPRVSKATALEAVRSALGVAPQETVFVGDGLNDLPALAWAGHAVAMGNAPAEVRRAADTVTGSLAQNGAAAVLRDLVAELAGSRVSRR
ncbi:HAD family hydrolase [Promicromonospora sukumoe]|uniref:HAD superfamily hydrolase (TIGR01484 family) n=1 Tax=Promicromonospora sukumoe TaxID=88382 RepID=A0A7W3J7C9_9MICO|nr:HAD family hydrolase [Promicromonospora sukumoe]MBA8807652.1 HAD superfamily hydrolase (TIGR01484 family) [Promicromonospora sukumoe]